MAVHIGHSGSSVAPSPRGLGRVTGGETRLASPTRPAATASRIAASFRPRVCRRLPSHAKGSGHSDGGRSVTTPGLYQGRSHADDSSPTSAGISTARASRGLVPISPVGGSRARHRALRVSERPSSGRGDTLLTASSRVSVSTAGTATSRGGASIGRPRTLSGAALPTEGATSRITNAAGARIGGISSRQPSRRRAFRASAVTSSSSRGGVRDDGITITATASVSGGGPRI